MGKALNVVEYPGLLPIWANMRSLTGQILERRIAVMARVEVIWVDPAGITRSMMAKLEDTSRGGACIRMTEALQVGSRLRIKWHKEQFSGIAKYCRSEAGEYVLGIQRDAAEVKVQMDSLPKDGASDLPTPSAAVKQEADAPPLVKAEELRAPLVEAMAAQIPNNVREPVAPPPSKQQDLPAPAVEPVAAPKPDKVSEPAAVQTAEVHTGTTRATQSSAMQAPGADGEAGDKFQKKENSAIQEGVNMLSKLLHMGSGSQQEEAPGKSASGANGSGTTTQSSPAPASRASASSSVRNLNRPSAELLPLDDIYHAAGILSVRSSYNIDSVIRMVDSNHLRGLSNDVKRASVLMALEAAGVPIDEVLRDAKQRQDAINTYEAGQRKQVEEYEARKTLENAQIQAEMEHISAHYAARMKRNLDDVAQAKETLVTWQTMKQEESQRITEAVGLCVKRPAAEPASAPAPVLQPVGAGVKS